MLFNRPSVARAILQTALLVNRPLMEGLKKTTNIHILWIRGGGGRPRMWIKKKTYCLNY